MPGVGYRVIARYNENQICVDSSGDDSKWVCTNDVPFFLDLQVSYGLTRRIDLITDLRLGIARDDAARGGPPVRRGAGRSGCGWTATCA